VRGGEGGSAGGEESGGDLSDLLRFTAGEGVIGSGDDEGVDVGDMVGEGVTLGEGGGESGMSIEEFTKGMSFAECPFLQVQFEESGKRAIGSYVARESGPCHPRNFTLHIPPPPIPGTS
jgi:hypothetical protein